METTKATETVKAMQIKSVTLECMTTSTKYNEGEAYMTPVFIIDDGIESRRVVMECGVKCAAAVYDMDALPLQESLDWIKGAIERSKARLNGYIEESCKSESYHLSEVYIEGLATQSELLVSLIKERNMLVAALMWIDQKDQEAMERMAEYESFFEKEEC